MRPPASPAEGPIRWLAGYERSFALTFDDGPDAVFTPRVLELLLARRVPATFFLLGGQAAERPDLVVRLRDGGFGIGVHSWDHVDLCEAGAPAARAQLARTLELLQGLGVTPSMFRPPMGSWNDELLAVARELGLRAVGWSVDPGDWDAPPEEVLVARAQDALRPGSIVLLHDGGGDRTATVAALPRILDHAERSGLACVDLAGALGLG